MPLGNRYRFERCNVSRPAPSLYVEFVSQKPNELRIVSVVRSMPLSNRRLPVRTAGEVGTEWCGRGGSWILSSCQQYSAWEPDRSRLPFADVCATVYVEHFPSH